jgi:hypothetical protein
LQNEEFEFHAAINGIDLSGEEESPPSEDPKFNNVESSSVPLFGDPEKYSHLSEEEKQSITESMKKKHQIWSSEKKA